MRIMQRKSIRGHRPFAGEGASLYAHPEYRNLRIDPGLCLVGAETTIGGDNINKTARLDSVAHPVDEFAIDSTLYASSEVTWQVRTFKDDVENETEYRPTTVEYDGSGADVTPILGTAVFVASEIRAAGIVRIRFRWTASRSGTQPTQFLAIRTAGPTSPANAAVTAAGTGLYYIDTPTLSDASAYTYKIQAKNGSVTADVLTGISFTADATGPTAPTSGTLELI